MDPRVVYIMNQSQLTAVRIAFSSISLLHALILCNYDNDNKDILRRPLLASMPWYCSFDVVFPQTWRRFPYNVPKIRQLLFLIASRKKSRFTPVFSSTHSFFSVFSPRGRKYHNTSKALQCFLSYSLLIGESHSRTLQQAKLVPSTVQSLFRR